jgi:hypothetical protein
VTIVVHGTSFSANAVKGEHDCWQQLRTQSLSGALVPISVSTQQQDVLCARSPPTTVHASCLVFAGAGTF